VKGTISGEQRVSERIAENTNLDQRTPKEKEERWDKATPRKKRKNRNPIWPKREKNAEVRPYPYVSEKKAHS